MTDAQNLPRNITYQDVENAHVGHILNAAGIATCGNHYLLDILNQICVEMRKLSHARRLLIGYARDNVHPPRYTLQELANATGMSISGVCTAYDGADLAQLLDILYPVNTAHVANNSQEDLTEDEPPW